VRKKKVGNRGMRDELKAISSSKWHTNYNRSTLRSQKMMMKGNDTRIKGNSNFRKDWLYKHYHDQMKATPCALYPAITNIKFQVSPCAQ